jgi:hypothetical protein
VLRPRLSDRLRRFSARKAIPAHGLSDYDNPRDPRS